MDLKSTHNSPVLADPVPINKSRLSLRLGPYLQPGSAFSSSLYLTTTHRRKAMPGKLDDLLASGWLDEMSSSSPQKKVAKDSSFETLVDENEALYRTWVMKYPSALTLFEQITNFPQGKKIALFLDYDGTLSPIVDNPDNAFMTDAMRTAVKNVAKYFPTAIISGRSRDKVFEFIGLTELYYAGSHGMDILGPVKESGSGGDHPNCIRSTDKQGKEVNLFQPASEFLPMIDEVFSSLVENTKDIRGSNVENNKFCVSVHYRNVDEKSWPLIAQIVHDVLKDFPRLRLTYGRKHNSHEYERESSRSRESERGSSMGRDKEREGAMSPKPYHADYKERSERRVHDRRYSIDYRHGKDDRERSERYRHHRQMGRSGRTDRVIAMIVIIFIAETTVTSFNVELMLFKLHVLPCDALLCTFVLMVLCFVIC